MMFFDSGSTHYRPARPALFAIGALACCLLSSTLQAAITYVQGNYAAPQTSPTTVSVTFSAAQVAGDLNVVVVGWNNSTATVSHRHRHARQHLRTCGGPDGPGWNSVAVHILCQKHRTRRPREQTPSR